MEIKVKNIQIREILQYGKGNLTHNTKIPVVEAKLVLVECKKEQGGLLWRNNHGDLLKDFTPAFGWDAVKCLKPILISETEKIEVGDKFLVQIKDNSDHVAHNKIFTCRKIGETGIWSVEEGTKSIFYNQNVFKILALPEHFTLMQLDHLVWGNLRNGDKVYVECEFITGKDRKVVFDYDNTPIVAEKIDGYYHIKSPLSIYPIEEKMYTKEEVRKLTKDAWVQGYYNPTTPEFEDWFERNVK